MIGWSAALLLAVENGDALQLKKMNHQHGRLAVEEDVVEDRYGVDEDHDLNPAVAREDGGYLLATFPRREVFLDPTAHGLGGDYTDADGY